MGVVAGRTGERLDVGEGGEGQITAGAAGGGGGKPAGLSVNRTNRTTEWRGARGDTKELSM